MTNRLMIYPLLLIIRMNAGITSCAFCLVAKYSFTNYYPLKIDETTIVEVRSEYVFKCSDISEKNTLTDIYILESIL